MRKITESADDARKNSEFMQSLAESTRDEEYSVFDNMSETRRKMFERIMGTDIEAAATYGEGDVVEYDPEGHVGVVLEVHTSDFTPPEEDAEEDSYEVGDGETVYVVARETEGFGYYTDDDLAEGSFPDTPGDPAGDLRDRAADEDVDVEALDAELDAYPAVDASDPPSFEAAGTGVPGWVGFPPSWEKSEIPARIILLDAWTSMGASWTGAYKTFQKDNTNRAAKKLASSMKDEVYGSTAWRRG